MLIITSSKEQKKAITKRCDERCMAGEWCIFGPYRKAGLCPVKGDRIQALPKGCKVAIIHDNDTNVKVVKEEQEESK